MIDLTVVDATSYHYPKDEVVEMCRRFTAAGVRVWLADQTLSWFPNGLWVPELAPIAAEWRRNAFWDVYSLAGYLAAKVPGSKFLFSLDVVRRGPDVLAQTMMTLQELAGDVMFALGSGEIKQLAPFGYHEERPVGRVKEQLQLVRRLWTSEEPFSFRGKALQLTNAELGTRSHDGKLPKLSVVGTGPKLIEIGARYADAIMVWAPLELMEETIAGIKRMAASFDRDPRSLTFWGGNPSPGMVMTYETADELERLRAVPITKFIAAAWGRMSSADWASEGLESPLGPDWHYAKDMIPTEWSTDRVRDVIDRTPAEMVERGILWWTVEDVARHFAKVIRAGIDMPSWMDWTPFADPSKRWASTERAIAAGRRAAEILAAEG